MAYVPQNINVYSAAFAGAIAGISVPNGAFVIDPVTGNYAGNANVAAFFAQAVDIAWGTGQANDYDLGAITQASNAIFARGPGYPLGTPLTSQSNWTIVATALVAMIRQGDTNASNTQNIALPAQYTASGIIPGPCPVGVFTHQIVPVPTVREGDFAITLVDATADDFVITVQHVSTGEIHLFVFNIAAGAPVNIPVQFKIFRGA
jgi:hypothetical protein